MRRLIATVPLAAAIAIAIAAVFLPSNAHAEGRTVHDETGPDQQNRANAMTHAAITYAPRKVVWRIKVKALSKGQTQAFGSIYYPDDDVYVKVATRHNSDGDRLTYGTYYNGFYDRFTSGLTARWDYARDLVTITLTKDWVLYNPRNWATFDAYTVEKGAMHGPHCERGCNDDYVITPLRRG